MVGRTSGRTPSSARDPLVALFLSLSTLTPDTTLDRGGPSVGVPANRAPVFRVEPRY